MLLQIGCMASMSTAVEEIQDDALPWYRQLDVEWGGHIKVQGSTAWHDAQSIYAPVGVGTGPLYDGNINLRLNSRICEGEMYMSSDPGR